MMLRRIFGPKRDEVTREWRKLHNKELIDQYCSHNIVRVIKSRRPFGRHRRRWEDNTKMDLLEEGCGGMEWIELAEDRDRW